MEKRTLCNYFTSNSSSSCPTDESTIQSKKLRLEFNPNEIIADPVLRIPIEDYANEIRDQMKRAYLLNGPTRVIGYSFPQTLDGKQSWSFQESWYNKFDWLEYSVEKDAAFCFYCFLFKKPAQPNTFESDVFTKVGFSHWKVALYAFNKHGGTNSSHNIARGLYDDFKNQRSSVSNKINTYSKEAGIAYKIRLTASLDCARYLIAQDEVFRGYDESSTSINKGNFKELLDWYKDKNEEVKVAFDTAPGHTAMISPDIQKELYKCCAQEVTEVIKDEIGDRNFAVLIDESRDVSIKEQMVVIVRFVNNQGKVMEMFLAIEHITNCTSAALKEVLVGLLTRHGLPISRLRGQGYDGVSNMRAVTGLHLESGLARPGDTRWGSHLKTLLRIYQMWEVVVDVLEFVSEDACQNSSHGRAAGLLKKMECFEFIFIMHFLITILSITNELSLALQRKHQDIVEAMGLLQNVKQRFQDMRDNGWEPLFNQVKSFCETYKVVTASPRRTRRPVAQSPTPWFIAQLTELEARRRGLTQQ